MLEIENLKRATNPNLGAASPFRIAAQSNQEVIFRVPECISDIAFLHQQLPELFARLRTSREFERHANNGN